MSVPDEKYVVFKREDWDASWKGKIQQPACGPLADAVVIRTQDVFATSGLRAYRDTMLTHRNLLYGLFKPEDYPPSMMEEMIEHLDRAIAYFTEVTIEAEDRFNRGECKVPD